MSKETALEFSYRGENPTWTCKHLNFNPVLKLFCRETYRGETPVSILPYTRVGQHIGRPVKREKK